MTRCNFIRTTTHKALSILINFHTERSLRCDANPPVHSLPQSPTSIALLIFQDWIPGNTVLILPANRSQTPAQGMMRHTHDQGQVWVMGIGFLGLGGWGGVWGNWQPEKQKARSFPTELSTHKPYQSSDANRSVEEHRCNGQINNENQMKNKARNHSYLCAYYTDLKAVFSAAC